MDRGPKGGTRRLMAKKRLPPLAVMPSAIFTDSRLSKTDLRVLGVLAARRNRKTGRCFPSKNTIGDDIGVDLSHEKTSLRRLKKFGHLDWTLRKDQFGRDISSEYTFSTLHEGGENCAKGGETRPPMEGETCPPNIEGGHRIENTRLGSIGQLALNQPYSSLSPRRPSLDNKLPRFGGFFCSRRREPPAVSNRGFPYRCLMDRVGISQQFEPRTRDEPPWTRRERRTGRRSAYAAARLPIALSGLTPDR